MLTHIMTRLTSLHPLARPFLFLALLSATLSPASSSINDQMDVDGPCSHPCNYADADPHVMFHVQGIDQPLCYDLIGHPGDVWTLFNSFSPLDLPRDLDAIIDAARDDDAFSVRGTLIHAPFKKNGTSSHTYFGKFHFHFQDGPALVEVTPSKITVSEDTYMKTVAWPKRVHNRNLIELSTDLAGPSIIVRHERWNVVSVAHRDSISEEELKFYVIRSNRKFRRNSKSPLETMPYLGIYSKHRENTQFGGIVGEFGGISGVLTHEGNDTFVTLDDRKKVQVVDHTAYNHISKKHSHCWHVASLEDILRNSIYSYYNHF